MNDYEEIEEAEANYFAAHLLVPSSLLRDELEKIGGKIDLANDKKVKALAKTFGVPVGILILRLVEENKL